MAFTASKQPVESVQEIWVINWASMLLMLGKPTEERRQPCRVIKVIERIEVSSFHLLDEYTSLLSMQTVNVRQPIS